MRITDKREQRLMTATPEALEAERSSILALLIGLPVRVALALMAVRHAALVIGSGQ